MIKDLAIFIFLIRIKRKIIFILLSFLISCSAWSLATEEPLSLNFQNIKVKSVLQLLAKLTDHNMIVSDTVKGSITLNLNKITYQDALTIILKMQGLTQFKLGSVVLIMPIGELAKNEKQALIAEKTLTEARPLFSQFIQLNYVKAHDLVKLIHEDNNALLSRRGKVRVDSRTNSLWLQDTQAKLNAISDLVYGLDVPLRQVLIEARIINIDTRYEEELGIRFEGKSSLTQDQAGSRRGVHLNVNLPAVSNTISTVPTLEMALARLGKHFLLDLELSAIETEGGGKLISSPRLVTLNQHQASIEAGEEIPFQQTNEKGAPVTIFKKAVLGLHVTPRITLDNKIIMNIKVNEDRRSNTTVAGTAINTQTIETQVLINNKETLVLGGIFKQNEAKTVERVPFLSDLPIIGTLFKNNKKERDREELLIFITPTIIEPLR